MYNNNIDSIMDKFQLNLGKINFHVSGGDIKNSWGGISKEDLKHQVRHSQYGEILCDGRCISFSGWTRQNEYK